MEKKYMIGFDVGGTKIDAVLFDDSGLVLSRVSGKGAVPADSGMDAALECYLNVVNALTAGFDGKIAALYGSVATVDYFGGKFQALMRDKLPQIGKMRIEEDGPCLISGVLGHADGCSIICGTGSSLYIRQGDKYHHLGGGGYLIDSCGSGYVLGRMALTAVFRAGDKRAEPTVLTELLEKSFGESFHDHYTEIYRGGRAYIASLANKVFEARDMGDAVAVKIFNHCAGELADLVWAAYRELARPFELVYNGGIFSHHSEYAEAVRALSPGCVKAVFSDVKPVYGCAVEAMYDVGLCCDARFKQTFIDSYEATTHLPPLRRE